jgi:hypothetical protein
MEVSGNPTIVKLFIPFETSVSTVTGTASIPVVVLEVIENIK